MFNLYVRKLANRIGISEGYATVLLLSNDWFDFITFLAVRFYVFTFTFQFATGMKLLQLKSGTKLTMILPPDLAL